MLKKINFLLLSFLFTFSINAQTVFDIVVNSADHTTLEAAIFAADLDETLSGAGTFTLFAPTDAAFAALPAGTVDALLTDPSGALTDILLYHVLGSTVLSTDLSNNLTTSTINGQDIIVRIEGGNVFINDAQVTVADIETTNGVVHVIDAVLVPSNTVFDVVVNSGDHTTLEAAIFAADLDETLSGAGTFTLFAPTDAAFAALPAGTVEALLADPSGALTDILLYHALGSTVLSTDLSNNLTTSTINGQDIIVRIEGGNVFINDAQVTVADIETTNGVVHVIDAVLVPSNTVFDVVINSGDHTTLEAAIFAADLDETLSGAGTFTLFAPTDAAFAALPAGTVEALLADPSGALTDILLYHALGSTVLSTDLSNNLTTSTINGQDIIVRIEGGNVFINDAQVTVADIETTNGVVHVIDAVLVPSNTVFDVVVNSGDHTTLEAAIFAADLDETLSGAGTFTLFAPTDAAFAALPAGTVEALLADPSGALTDILLYHALGSTVLSTDLSNNLTTSTINGQDIIVRIEGGNVFINDAQVTVADIETTNGVVHVIDAVLVPSNTVFDVVVNSGDHTTLEAAIFAADLDETLSGAGTFTLFAPTDAAFAALPAGTVEALLADPSGALTDILLYHALGSTVLSTDLSNNLTTSTINGQDIIVRIEGGNVFINDAQVTVADIETTNGVVHVIDAVLVPSNTVFDVVVNSGDHTTLEAAIFAADLDETLSGAGTFTLFAPTDAAFAALPAGTVEALLADPSGALTDILLYHALGSTVLSTDLSNNLTTSTINGQDIIVRIEGGNVFINDAQVTVADIETTNGVVHVIDAVLVPSNTVFDVVVNSGDHTTLEAAIFAADLDETLSGAGTFTLFAPTDAAFAALPAGVLDGLLADPTGALANTLLLHALGSTVLSGTLSDGMMAEALSGDDLLVTIENGEVMINNAKVIIADIETTNGVVHVVDAVISPLSSAVNIDLEDVNLNIFPNPASDFISIDALGFDASLKVRIFNNLGKVVNQFDMNSNTRQLVNTGNLVNGIYFVEMRTKNNVYQKQILIQK